VWHVAICVPEFADVHNLAMGSERSFDGLRRKVTQITALLEELSDVPMIQKEIGPARHDLAIGAS
jgi:hypothetical protein